MNAQDDMIKALIKHQTPIHVSAPSKHIAEVFKDTFGYEAEILPPPMPLPNMPKRRSFKKTEGIIWSCEVWKGSDLALKIFKQIQKKRPDIPLVYHVYGSPKEREKAYNKAKKTLITFII